MLDKIYACICMNNMLQATATIIDYRYTDSQLLLIT